MSKAQFYYYSEFVMILIVIILIILSAIMMKLNPQKYTMKKPKTTLICGIILSFFSIVFNSAKENRWDVRYILSFICFKNVSHDSYLRSLLYLSFVPIMMGFVQLLFTHLGFLKFKNE